MERNQKAFEDKEMSLKDLFEKAKFLASLWSSTDSSFKNFPIIFDYVKLGRHSQYNGIIGYVVSVLILNFIR